MVVRKAGENMFVKNEQGKLVPVIPGIGRKTLSVGDKVMLVEVYLEKGADMAEHAHPHEQVGYVVRGKVEFTIEDEMTVLNTGDSYAITSNKKHKVKVLEDSLLIDIFSPPRDEWR